MNKYTIETTESYRVDSEKEVEELIEKMKNDAMENGYILKSYNSTLKEKKAKGEIVDSAFLVKFTKVFNNFWEC